MAALTIIQIIFFSVISLFFLIRIAIAMKLALLKKKRLNLEKEKQNLKWDSYNAREEGRHEYDPEGIHAVANEDHIVLLDMKIKFYQEMIQTLSLIIKL